MIEVCSDRVGEDAVAVLVSALRDERVAKRAVVIVALRGIVSPTDRVDDEAVAVIGSALRVDRVTEETVAIVASVLIERSVCSHLPSVLPGAFVET
jgi:hypothetical protein